MPGTNAENSDCNLPNDVDVQSHVVVVTIDSDQAVTQSVANGEV